MTEREAFEAYAADNIPDYQSPTPYTAADVEANVRTETWAAWQAACAWQREQIADAIVDALQSDLENGVKWLNERASDRFKTEYPELNAVLAAIRAQGEQ